MPVETQGAVIDPQHGVIGEPVRGSDIPMQLMYIEMVDGVYAPIGLRTPRGEGPFPLVLFASDAVQQQAVADSVAFFDGYLKGTK